MANKRDHEMIERLTTKEASGAELTDREWRRLAAATQNVLASESADRIEAMAREADERGSGC